MILEKQDIKVWVKWSDEPMLKGASSTVRFIDTKQPILAPFTMIQVHDNAHEIEWLKKH